MPSTQPASEVMKINPIKPSALATLLVLWTERELGGGCKGVSRVKARRAVRQAQ